MAKRVRTALKAASYFVSDKPGIKFVTTGCTLLDCVLGGGYPLGRVVNIVGDKSTAKTALATEAMINFLRQYPDGGARYNEAEAAFDQDYAAAMGLPLAQVDFGNPEEPTVTVEDFERDITAFTEKQLKAKEPGIYILDSLDALSDEAEMARDVGENTYAMNKAKALSTMFRKMIRKLERSNVLLIVISQVRDNIGVSFGEKHKRSGGRALDFYASQVLFLAHLKTLKRTISKVERPVGISIRAKCKKNKVGLAFRECEFDFMFGYGIDDVAASVDWLNEVDRLEAAALNKTNWKTFVKELDALPPDEFAEERARVAKAVVAEWRTIETSFLPKRTKYA